MSCLTLTDAETGSRVEIALHLGFNAYAFRAVVEDRTVDVIAAAADFPQTGVRPSGHGTPLLFPFPNRIRRGRFTWEGREYQLPLHPVMGHAIHGFALDRPWRLLHQGERVATAEFQLSRDAPDRLACWPADGLIQVTYRLRGAALRLDVRVVNPDTRPLPFGFGTHTYFRLPLGAGSEAARCLVQAPAAEQWVLEECLPTGERRPVPPTADLRDGARFGDLKLDDVLTGLIPTGDRVECVLMDEAAGLEVVQQFDPQFRELVAFTPSWLPAICLEPYTCVTDAVNLAARGIDSGWRILAPGEEWRAWIQIAARPILV